MTATPEVTALMMLSMLFREATPVEGEVDKFSFNSNNAMNMMIDTAKERWVPDDPDSNPAKFIISVMNEFLRLLVVEYSDTSDNPAVIADSLEIRATAVQVLGEMGAE